MKSTTEKKAEAFKTINSFTNRWVNYDTFYDEIKGGMTFDSLSVHEQYLWTKLVMGMIKPDEGDTLEEVIERIEDPKALECFEYVVTSEYESALNLIEDQEVEDYPEIAQRILDIFASPEPKLDMDELTHLYNIVADYVIVYKDSPYTTISRIRWRRGTVGAGICVEEVRNDERGLDIGVAYNCLPKDLQRPLVSEEEDVVWEWGIYRGRK